MGLLKKLLGSDHVGADVATGDWTPVPPTATAEQHDWATWMQHEPAPEPAPCRAEAAPPPKKADVLDYLSPEERAIVEAQKVDRLETTPVPPTVASRPRTLSGASEVHTAPARPTSPRLRALRAETVRPAPEPAPTKPEPAAHQAAAAPTAKPTEAKRKPSQSWTDMLRAFGEHLTDEELLLIRDQLPG